MIFCKSCFYDTYSVDQLSPVIHEHLTGASCDICGDNTKSSISFSLISASMFKLTRMISLASSLKLMHQLKEKGLFMYNPSQNTEHILDASSIISPQFYD